MLLWKWIFRNNFKFLGGCFLPLSKILEKFWGRTPPPSRGWGGKFFHIHLFSLFEARVLDILIFKTPSQKFESPNPTSGGGLDWGRRGNFYIIDCFHPKKLAWLKFVFYVAHHLVAGVGAKSLPLARGGGGERGNDHLSNTY